MIVRDFFVDIVKAHKIAQFTPPAGTISIKDTPCICCGEMITAGEKVHVWDRKKFTAYTPFKALESDIICDKCAYMFEASVRKAEYLVNEDYFITDNLFTDTSIAKNIDVLRLLFAGEFKAPFLLVQQKDITKGNNNIGGISYRSVTSAKFAVNTSVLTTDPGLVAVNYTNKTTLIDMEHLNNIYNIMKVFVEELQELPKKENRYKISSVKELVTHAKYGNIKAPVNIEAYDPIWSFMLMNLEKVKCYVPAVEEAE